MSRVGITLPAGATQALEARLQHLDRDHFARRLSDRDPTLWGADPARQQVAARRLGWLTAPATMKAQAPALRAFRDECAAERLDQAILIGMGGSSLAPEVLRDTFGMNTHPASAGEARGASASSRSSLTVLDTTSPDEVGAALAAHDPLRTLCIVSSKSGSTIEVSSLEKCCYEWARAARGDTVGRGFVAVTDPGTPLERLASDRGYRHTFSGDPDIGGRYSALSPFGLVPAAWMGIDLDRLLDGAQGEIDTLTGAARADRIEGVRLGAALGELALAGRDKVTLLLGPGLEALGAWVEQLLAESTGKEGRGLIPVIQEPPDPAAQAGPDRVFVAVSLDRHDRSLTARLDSLARAGHPVLEWTRSSALDLGAEFVRWEIATAVAGAVLDVDPFDEPNVAEAKRETHALLETFAARGALPERAVAARAGGVEAVVPAALSESLGMPAKDGDPGSCVRALLSLARPGDYVALLAFLPRTRPIVTRLERLRQVIGRLTRHATTLGYGPRYLHSTGQLHKGGPNTGIFLQLTCDEDERAIPGERYGLGTLRRAQADGDLDVLARHERRALRVHLGRASEDGLVRLAAGLEATREIHSA